jgi:hypothetical protein
MRFLRSLFVVALATTGCAYATPTTHIPAAMPAIDPYSFDVTGVTVVDHSHGGDPEVAADVRHETAIILLRAAKRRGGESGPTRVTVNVELIEKSDIRDALAHDGIAIFGFWPVPFGMVTGRERLKVDVTVFTNGRSFVGHGSANRIGSIYAPALRRSLAVALDEALADAARSAAAPH